LFGIPPLKAQNAYIFQKFLEEHGPFGPTWLRLRFPPLRRLWFWRTTSSKLFAWVQCESALIIVILFAFRCSATIITSKITRSIPGLRFGLADLPNVPYRYVFRQLSSEVSHLHRTPLKSCHSATIRTTVVWGACERKSRSSACRRSNVGLPICLHPFLMQSTVLQTIIQVLNITLFPITLYSLRFMIQAKTKPNNGLSGVGFSWAFFFRFVASQPHQFCQISCANNQQVENLK